MRALLIGPVLHGSSSLLVCSSARLLVCSSAMAASCLCGCSLKDYDYLSRGVTAEAGQGGATEEPIQGGGAAGQPPQPGGSAGEAHPQGGSRPSAGSTSLGGVSPAGDAGAHSAGQGGTSGSTGVVTCEDGLTYCASDAQCVDLQRGSLSGKTVVHCGACDMTCDMTHATDVTCDAGECKPTCSVGHEDCNGAANNDGCETDLSSTSNCGACGRECSDVGVARVSCTDGACTPECLPGFGDCNEDEGAGTDDGCEVYLDDLTRCGTTCDEGVACEANQVCNAGVCGAARGLVMFSVPLTQAGDKQRYGDKFAGPVDLADSTVLIRVYAPEAQGGSLVIYVNDREWRSGSRGIIVPLDTLSNGWSDVELLVGSVDDVFDPSGAQQLSFEVEASPPGPWTNPTIVYIDSIRSQDGGLDHAFDTSLGTVVVSASQTVEGSTATWLDAIPDSAEGGAGAGEGGTGG